MKRLLPILGMIAVLTSCAKERTITHFSTQGITPDGTDTSILTNADYEKQQEEKRKQKLNRKKDPSIKPVQNPENYLTMDMDFEQEDIAKLYDAMDVAVESVGPPKGVYEYIAQERLQKSVGRLSCTKQRPLPEALVNTSAPHYYCSLDFSDRPALNRQDKLIYEFLKLAEKEDEHSNLTDRTFSKSVGRFHSEKAINIQTGEVKYTCGIYQIYAATEVKIKSQNLTTH